jgi:integrase
MASISTNSDGLMRILFIDADGERRTIYLGHASEYTANTYQHHVEQILSAQRYSHAIDGDTVRWLTGLDDTMHGRLAKAGLVDRREASTLGGWLDAYLEERKPELKPRSLQKLRDTADSLIAFLGAKTLLRKITTAQASAWRQDLQAKVSLATVRTFCGNAKQFIREAVNRKLIADNAFSHLKSGSTAKDAIRYVKPEEIDAVIKKCPNSQWALLFGLARYAGLRVPSETHQLTSLDVNYEKHVLTVRSPKTERHPGHEKRLVPISPRLMKLILARDNDLKTGESLLVNLRGGNLRKQALKIIAAAEVELWPDLWQSLRSSAEKEWALTMPQYAVSRWIGHSITMSGKHYTVGEIPQELYDKAAGLAPKEATQKTTQQHSAEGSKASEDAGDKAMTPHSDAEECSMSSLGNEADGSRTRNLRRDRPAL